MTRHGRIDVLVNNAGFGLMGALEEVTEADARYHFDVNFFGLLDFTKAVLPHMRAQNSGVIVHMSSGAAILAGPVYAASKFAVEGLAEGLANEVKPFSIRVHLIELGISRTNFLGQVAQGKQVRQKIEGYLNMGGILGSMHGMQSGTREKGVQRIFEVVMGTDMGEGMEWDLRVPLGLDCFGMFEAKAKSLRATLEKMKNIALSTDFVV